MGGMEVNMGARLRRRRKRDGRSEDARYGNLSAFHQAPTTLDPNSWILILPFRLHLPHLYPCLAA
jgi:hypothetical protein